MTHQRCATSDCGRTRARTWDPLIKSPGDQRLYQWLTRKLKSFEPIDFVCSLAVLQTVSISKQDRVSRPNFPSDMRDIRLESVTRSIADMNRLCFQTNYGGHPGMFLHRYYKRSFVMLALKTLRTKLIATLPLTFLSGGTVAVAQNQDPGSSGATSSTIPQAPIGHRQPRGDQVPPGKSSADLNKRLDKENAVLGQKMKSICRGC
jgi:hypothetical protein